MLKGLAWFNVLPPRMLDEGDPIWGQIANWQKKRWVTLDWSQSLNAGAGHHTARMCAIRLTEEGRQAMRAETA